jgi:hypothetical protein
VFSGVFIAEEVDGAGDKGSGDTTTVDVQTLLEVFLNMSLRSTCFTDEHFSDKEQNVWSRDYSQVPNYQDFKIIRHGINRILLYIAAG